MLKHELEPEPQRHRVRETYFAGCRSVQELALSGLTNAEQIALALFLAELLARRSS